MSTRSVPPGSSAARSLDSASASCAWVLPRPKTPQTWHYGLVAEWWANFNTDGPEIEYFRRHVEHAQPVLDAGCGTGRLLVPWLQAGINVDGCDASADMVALCRKRARTESSESMCADFRPPGCVEAC